MRAAALLLLFSLGAAPAGAGQASAPPDGIDLLVAQIQNAIQAGDPLALRALSRFDTNLGQLNEFATDLTLPTATRATVKERDRARLVSGRQRLLLEIFTERAQEGRVSTWRVDVAPPEPPAPTGRDAAWQIAAVQRLTVVTGLYRLSLDRSFQYDVHNLDLHVTDLRISLPAGRAFVAQSADGPTAVVLLGRGRVEFSPKPEAERGQVRIFCGEESFRGEFDATFLRLNPGQFDARFSPSALVKRPANPRDFRRASEIFETYSPLSFQVDLSDLSPERWSLVPGFNDFVAEIVTRRYGPLTYARATSEPEDISFFDRRHHKNISVYASAAQDRFFSEDDQREYDITSYDVRASFSPDRLWVDGHARISLRTRAPVLSTITLRLADPLVVRNITSPQFGRLLYLRIVGQNSILINLPTTLLADTDLDLTVVYGGRLQPQGLDREALDLLDQPQLREDVTIPFEPSFVYSNRSYWYPQSIVTDFATARVSIIVPSDFDVVASGTPVAGPIPVEPPASGQRARKEYQFSTEKPARYLAVVLSRFQRLRAAQLTLPAVDAPAAADPSSSDADGRAGRENTAFDLYVQANPRQFNRAKSFGERAADILTFYSSIIGDVPYGSFTVALTESDLPGGHSPAYFAIVNQPLPTSPFVWRNDPVAFENYPSFFLAHEIAHQWWGQAVGWKNYHEQWLSEGFAQYFAALYAQRERGTDEFTSIIRQMRRWGIDMSPQGPIYLGYRLGHIKSNSRVFRALIYNKAAIVLHMLRRLVGDDAFFSGLRQFYLKWRYDKAGTDDFRIAMEAASGRPLQRFFDGWIFGSAIPTVRFTVLEASDTALRVRFEQLGNTFEIPITVSVTYMDGTSQDVVVPVVDKITEPTIPSKGRVRSVDVNRDGAALAEIVKE